MCGHVDSGVFEMIKVNLYAFGKIKEDFFLSGEEEYAKRLKKFCEFNVFEIKDQPLKSESDAEIDRALEREADAFFRAIKGEYYAFAVEGKSVTSEKFAEIVSSQIDCGKDVNFVIGSSYGLSPRVKSGAKGLISFSAATFPHTLFRLIACEQIYRAFTIISGATYHK